MTSTVLENEAWLTDGAGCGAKHAAIFTVNIITRGINADIIVNVKPVVFRANLAHFGTGIAPVALGDFAG